MEWLSSARDIDPITYQYFADLRHVPAVDIEVAHARFGIMGFPFDQRSANPFVLAFDKVKASAVDSINGIEPILSSFYQEVQPRSALEVLDLTACEAPGLCDIPSPHWIAPWGTETVEQRAWRLRMWSVKDGLANGRLVSAKDGLINFGPVSRRKIALETERIAKLATSIRARGFVNSCHGAPEVFGLRTGGDYRWFVIRGQHRFAACAAFGIEKVKARVIKIVRREDVGAWPHVVSGSFTGSGALKLFDRLFAGEAPSCAAPWVKRHCYSQLARAD